METALLIVLYAAALVMIYRFFLHMLQLSSYQFQGYFRFLNTELLKWMPLPFAVVPAAAFLLDFTLLGWILGAACLGILIFLYYPKQQKKKFVLTARVWRLIGTLCIFLGILLLAGAAAPKLYRGRILLVILTAYLALAPLWLAFANLVNQPVEKQVREYYIRDAKKILASRPDLQIIGITGSFGKTSVKYYLTTLLSEQFRVLMTPSSFNTPMGVVKTIREDLQATHQIFVCEMGARHVGDIKEICDIVHPNHGIVTSIGYQHLETFHSLENIVSTKYELLEEVKQNGKGGLKFINGDNEVIRRNLRYPDAVTYGLRPDNRYHGDILQVSEKGTVFCVTAPSGETEEFRTSLLGRHNVENIIGAIAAANTLGIPMQKLRRAVHRLEGVPHRLQLIPKGNVTVIDDAYNSNPDGTKAALETLSLFDGVKILVTPGMVELGERQSTENELFGKNAAEVCDYIILVGDKNVRPIRNGALQAGFPEDRLFIKSTLAEAVKLMYELEAGRKKAILLENDLPDNYT